MYPQQQGAAYSGDGARKLNGPGAGAGLGAGSVNGSFSNGAYGSGYGAGGYNGATGFGDQLQGAGYNSLYGSGSMYGKIDANGTMMCGINEGIIVTKLFSSRRDLDHLVSARDFSRRFDSNWGSYYFGGSKDAGGSLYGANSVGGGSLMNLSGKSGVSFVMDSGVGAAGIGPDGNKNGGASEKVSAPGKKAETKEALGENGNGSCNPPPVGTANTKVSAQSDKAAPNTVKSRNAEEEKEKAHNTPKQTSTDARAKTNESAVESVSVPNKEAKASTVETTEAKPTAGDDNVNGNGAPQTVKGGAGKVARVMNAQETKHLTADPIDDIPLLADDVRPKPQPAAQTAKPEAQTAQTSNPTEPSNQTGEAAHAVDGCSATNTTKSTTANGEGRHPRPRSRQATRPVSRLTSMSVVEFPEAEEVNDEMVKGGLHDPEEVVARAEMRREREDAARVARDERQRQQQIIDAQKQREEEARKRRQKKDDEAQQRKEMLTKMDEERKRERDAAVAARSRQREEEKRRFETMKQLEDEKEATRASAVIAERQRQLEAENTSAEDKTTRSTSRQRSRRPSSRPSSRLRALIPEQPPDVMAGEVEDTLAADPLRKSTLSDDTQAPCAAQANRRAEPLNEGRGTSNPAGVRGEPASRSKRSPTPLSQQKQTSSAERGMSVHPTGSGAPAPLNGKSSSQPPGTDSRRSLPKEDKSGSTAGKKNTSRPPNMVKTLVLVEELNHSNHALTTTDKSISYNGQTTVVTEVKTRPEGNFNYHSSVVHDVSEAVCGGYNAAVLAVDAPNTAGRFDSPVWSILNRIVRTLLSENSNEAGELRSDFQLTCAMGYLYMDKVKDLHTNAEVEAPFTKIGVNPSPIYGPRLTNLTYDGVTDPNAFEDMLTTTLSRASEDSTLQSLTEGVLAAFVLIMQTRETDGKPDIYLSSLVVATSSDDTFPYESAISHTRNEYATVFHLVLGGPSCTCFMLNIADDDTVCKAGETDESLQERIERLLGLLQRMSALTNYDLRSGSVKRFIKYVELSHTNAQTRLEREEDDGQRRKIERYLREQERLLQDAYRLLEEWNIKSGEGL
ncbi:hypothetical protein, conserved [Leishmania tarentolae]|uniref:Uncharacterized protein n=1 Tax=Leishmania tarentolae TaxID=5689 RepID=A0A640KRP6_LEITA|nr:hypothetical protein, conserved [Leishmania tarentolae]